MSKSLLKFVIPLFIVLFMSACALLGTPTQEPETNPDALYTQGVQTVEARLTQQAFDTLAAQLTQVAATLVTTPQAPTQTATAVILVPAASPTPTPSPTATLVPPTPLPPTPTSIPQLCDQAQFVKDVTVLDGTVFAPGAEFTKVWRLRNVGTCTWNSSYGLNYESGDRLGSRKYFPLPGNVRPGETVDLAVDFIAPSPGRYRSYWILSNANGKLFGIGKDADVAFWADIRVMGPNQNFAYDFAINMCTASWQSSADDLPCPGDTSSDDGSVALLTNPDLESNRTEDESTLWTRPEATRGGWIQGIYPPYKVKAGDHFFAEVGCLADNRSCEVTFSLDYQVSGGSVKSLGEWYEIYDGNSTHIDIDLSFLEGRTIQFILSVTNHGRPSHANAYWLAPSVRQVKPAPTPVPTISPTQVVLAPAISAARQRVAQDVGIDVSKITVVSFQLLEWKDTCLGIKLPDMNCDPTTIPGYKVNMVASGRSFEAHTNMDGSLIYWFEF